MPYNSRADVVRLLAKRYDTKSNVKLCGFQSQLQASYVSSHIEELWYNETVCLWMTIYIERETVRWNLGRLLLAPSVFIYIYIYIYMCMINQTFTTGLLVIFCFLYTVIPQTKNFLSLSSVNKERNITNKAVASVWFIFFSTNFYRLIRFTKILQFSLTLSLSLSLCIYIYIYIITFFYLKGFEFQLSNNTQKWFCVKIWEYFSCFTHRWLPSIFIITPRQSHDNQCLQCCVSISRQWIPLISCRTARGS